MSVLLQAGGRPLGGSVREMIRISQGGNYQINDIDVHFNNEWQYSDFTRAASQKSWVVCRNGVKGYVVLCGQQIEVDFCVGDLQTLFPAQRGQVNLKVLLIYSSN